MKPKTKKERFHRDYNDKFLTYRCLIFLSSMFLFFDKFMFEEKKVPTVTTHNALHKVYNFFISWWIHFCSEKISDTSAPTMGEGGGGGCLGWDWTKLVLNPIFIQQTVVNQTVWKNPWIPSAQLYWYTNSITMLKQNNKIWNNCNS